MVGRLWPTSMIPHEVKLTFRDGRRVIAISELQGNFTKQKKYNNLT